MKVNIRFLKHSNSGDIALEQIFTETSIKGLPKYYYLNGNSMQEDMDLKGFIEISKKTYERLLKN